MTNQTKINEVAKEIMKQMRSARGCRVKHHWMRNYTCNKLEATKEDYFSAINTLVASKKIISTTWIALA